MLGDHAPEGTKAQKELVVSASAAVRLGAARGWLATQPRDAECWILAPHGHAGDELAREEAAAHGSRFGLHRFTVDRLAARLAAPELARRGATPATSLTLTAVVTRAIHHVLERGLAGRFAAIARRPGFPHAAVRTIEELRGAGVSCAALRTHGPWGVDMAAILEVTENELSELALADRAELLTIARVAVESGALVSPPPILLLDLALEEKLDRDFVVSLTSHAPRVLATSPAGDASAIAALKDMLGVEASYLDDGEAHERSLSKLQRHLFQDSTPEQRALDETVTLTSWPGETRECVEIARRIQEAAARGVTLDRMSVLLRSPGQYRAHIEEALRRAAIPAYYARGTRRPDPAGRALLALLACAAEGLSARRFAEYLSLAQVPDPGRSPDEEWFAPDHEFMPAIPEPSVATAVGGEESDEAPDPDASVSEGTLRSPWRWEHLLVEASVIGGRNRWARRLDGLVKEIDLRRSDLAEDDTRAAGLARTAADLEHLRKFALPLIDRLAALPGEATWGVWIEHLRGLAAVAIRQQTALLRVLVELEPLGPVGPVDLMLVQHVLTPRLRELTEPSERRPGGSVFVAPIEMARGLHFDLVFVPGLAERLFPPRIIEDPLLPDAARRAIGAETLATQDSRVAAHRLALRLAVGAARAGVALSWPRVDVERARPLVPSFYALEALRAAEGRLPGFDELRSRSEIEGRGRLGWPAPESPERAIDDTEYDLAVLARLKNEDEAARVGAANYLLAASPHLARALRARGRRWLRRWTPADGLVDPDAEALAAMTKHRMGARSYSPTALEHFSACPYRFLLQAIHRIQPREESEALDTIDPLTRGALFHEIQFELLTNLRDGGHLPLDSGRLETAFGLLNQVVDRVAADYEERLAPAIKRVWADGVNSIKADLREWLRRSAEGAWGWVPHRFELSFGLTEHARPTADSSSQRDPVRVLDGALLRGSIDLVERRADGVLRVTDHKTGKARVPENAIVGGGQTLQPVLYALAAEGLLTGPVASGRLYYCTADGAFTERDIPLDDQARSSARKVIEVISRALETGFLPAAPAKDACRWCDYRPVCGSQEEFRTARKPQDRLDDLRTLRDIR